MKRTKQLARTDRDITEAVFALMEEKPFERITVADIIGEAGINRSTFYQHFPDKYAVLERVQDSFAGEMLRQAEAYARNKENDLSVINAGIMEILLKNRRRMMLLLSVKSDTVDMEGRLRQFIADYLARTGAAMNTVEREIMAGMLVTALTSYLSESNEVDDLSDWLLDMWLSMSVYFFRLDGLPDAKQRLLDTVAELYEDVRR